MTGERTANGEAVADEEAVAEAVAVQLDELMGPLPEPVETASSRTVQDDGAAERYERESPTRFAGG